MSESRWERLGSDVESFMSDIRDLRVVRAITPAELRGELEARYPLEVGVPLDRLIADVHRLGQRQTTAAMRGMGSLEVEGGALVRKCLGRSASQPGSLRWR